MWWKQNKWKVLIPVLAVIVLAAAFWYGGGAPGLQGWTVDPPAPTPPPRLEAQPEETPDRVEEPEVRPEEPKPDKTAVKPEEAPEPAPEEAPEIPEETPKAPEEPPEETAAPTPEPTPAPAKPETPAEGLETRPGGADGGLTATDKVALAAEIAGGSSPGVAPGDKAYSEAQGMVIDPNTGKDQYLTDPVPAGKPLPVEPQNTTISDTACTCTISISCATILDHMDWLDPEKAELVPEDGWILPPTQVTFYEGESVFNVLQRTCKQNKIHMEFENTPMYNSAYIEGIHNLYEFDCGELSGWMYKVNEWFPNYGCSRYALKDGDTICWEYTCDLGVDVGGFYATGG
ncbi:MAG: DUF4430 domain-containing protein [Oscillospiraceae bacterium]|nr:DUF4430 domain-containing protein [Oscillospiraceae bacterium]